MKKSLLLIFIATCVGLSSCAKYGCPSSGRNVGAEKLLSGDKKTAKAVKRAGKFKGGKF